MRAGCGAVLVFPNLAMRFAETNRLRSQTNSFSGQHIANEGMPAALKQLRRAPLIHNEIPGGFTIDTAWWTLMRGFWKDEPKSALLPGLQSAARWKKNGGKRYFCQVRGKQYWSICIVSLILLEVWILCDQYLPTASLFFCVTYYCRWNARPAPQLELWSRQGQSIA